jgi:hypothetical protein
MHLWLTSDVVIDLYSPMHAMQEVSKANICSYKANRKA